MSSKAAQQMNRRKFLNKLGLGAAAATVAPMIPAVADKPLILNAGATYPPPATAPKAVMEVWRRSVELMEQSGNEMFTPYLEQLEKPQTGSKTAT